jgi:hypothetical protein
VDQADGEVDQADGEVDQADGEVDQADGEAAVPGASATQTPAPAAEAETSTGDVPKPVSPSASAPTVRKVEGPDAEPVNLLAVSGGAMAKRLVPAAGGLAIVLVILYWLLGRG